jgi:hypothetical protein
MVICDGFDCDNKEFNKGNLCCNDCDYKECKYKCTASKDSCSASKEGQER